MNNVTVINNKQLLIKEFDGQRVVTFKDIDELHGRPEGTASRNFRENRDKFIPKTDYIHVNLTTDEIRRQFGAGKTASEIYLITESGYLMLVKSFTDDLAWEVQRQLVNNYFRAKELNPYSGLSKELQAIFILDKKQQELESRVLNLEDNMTIDYGQQLTLQDVAKQRAIDAMGGKDSPAYRNSSVRSKVFSQVWKDYKDYFQVNSYRNTPKKDFERAKEYLRSWQAQGKLLREIEDCNNQMQIDKEAM